MKDAVDMTNLELINQIRECHRNNRNSWFYHYLTALEERLKTLNVDRWKK